MTRTPEELAKECLDAWGAEFLRQDIKVSLGERIALAIRAAIAQEHAAGELAVAIEREACARAAERHAKSASSMLPDTATVFRAACDEIAAGIRARGAGRT
jgi:hypothetical protein